MAHNEEDGHVHGRDRQVETVENGSFVMPLFFLMPGPGCNPGHEDLGNNAPGFSKFYLQRPDTVNAVLRFRLNRIVKAGFRRCRRPDSDPRSRHPHLFPETQRATFWIHFGSPRDTYICCPIWGLFLNFCQTSPVLFGKN